MDTVQAIIINPASNPVNTTGGGAGGSVVQGAVTPVDNFANPANAVSVFSLTAGWSPDTSRWARIRAEGTNVDGEAVIDPTQNVPKVLSSESYPKMFNGATWDRVRGTIANGLAVDVTRVQGNMSVFGQSAVNAANSSVANLAANGTFTGVAVNVLPYGSVSVLVRSDVSSATEGLQVQFSNDGATWYDSSSFTYNAALALAPNQGQIFQIGVRAPFMRVVYVNGGTIQTAFVLQTTLNPLPATADIADIQNAIGTNVHAQIVKAILAANNRNATATPPFFTDLTVRSTAAIPQTDVVLSSDPALVTTLSPNRVRSLSAVYRLAARPYALSNVFAAAGRKQFATLTHLVSSIRTVRIKRVRFRMSSTTVAVTYTVDLVRLTTAAATGNPAITPVIRNSVWSATDMTALALPTTGGTEGALVASYADAQGVTGGLGTTNPATTGPYIVLYESQYANSIDDLVVPPGVAGGIAVVVDANAACTFVLFDVQIDWTEE